jgi:hypothetical protein
MRIGVVGFNNNWDCRSLIGIGKRKVNWDYRGDDFCFGKAFEN